MVFINPAVGKYEYVCALFISAVALHKQVVERALKRRSLFDARQELEGRLSKLSEQKLKALELLSELEERHGTAAQEAGARIIIPDNGRGRVEAGGEADGSG